MARRSKKKSLKKKQLGVMKTGKKKGSWIVKDSEPSCGPIESRYYADLYFRMQKLQWALVQEKNKNKHLLAKNNEIWIRNQTMSSEIAFLEGCLKQLLETTKELVFDLERSGKECVTSTGKLLTEKLQTACENSGFNSVQQMNTASEYESLKQSYKALAEEVQDFAIREARLQYQLQDAEENFDKDIRRYDDVIQDKDREIAKLKSEVEDLKEKQEKSKNQKRNRVDETESSDDKWMYDFTRNPEELASNMQEDSEERPRKKARKSKKMEEKSDDETADSNHSAPSFTSYSYDEKPPFIFPFYMSTQLFSPPSPPPSVYGQN